MNFSKVKDNALKYLGYQNQKIDDSFFQLLDECLQEIDQMASFKVTYQSFPLSFDPLYIENAHINIHYPDLMELFQNCHDVIVIGCTLGIQIDRKLKYYSHY